MAFKGSKIEHLQLEAKKNNNIEVCLIHLQEKERKLQLSSVSSVTATGNGSL